MTRAVTIHKLSYFLGVWGFGDEVTITKKWKIVDVNGDIKLYFDVVGEGWYDTDYLLIRDYKEFINGQ